LLLLDLDLLGQFHREVEKPIGFSGRFSNLVDDKLRGDGGGIEEFIQGDLNAADTFIAARIFQ
jgi:hypothetical protein